jgi:ATP-binding cassette subfamily A (ABC1) protein 3
MHQAFLRYTTKNPKASIKVNIKPLPFTVAERKTIALVTGVFAAFIFTVGMSFIPASLISYIVKERETNTKHQQVVSGVSIFSYWVSNYIVDLLKYLIPGLICPLLCKMYQLDNLVGDRDSETAVWTIFILYGFSIISFTYLISFLFKDYANSQVTNYFLNFVMGVPVAMTFFVLRSIPKTTNIAKMLNFVAALSPTFALGYGLTNISM